MKALILAGILFSMVEINGQEKDPAVRGKCVVNIERIENFENFANENGLPQIIKNNFRPIIHFMNSKVVEKILISKKYTPKRVKVLFGDDLAVKDLDLGLSFVIDIDVNSAENKFYGCVVGYDFFKGGVGYISTNDMRGDSINECKAGLQELLMSMPNCSELDL